MILSFKIQETLSSLPGGLQGDWTLNLKSQKGFKLN